MAETLTDDATARREAYMAEHWTQLEDALSKAVNALADKQPADPIAFIGQQLLQRQEKTVETEEDRGKFIKQRSAREAVEQAVKSALDTAVREQPANCIKRVAELLLERAGEAAAPAQKADQQKKAKGRREAKSQGVLAAYNGWQDVCQ